MNAREVCDALGITTYTLTNWYTWERKLIKQGRVDKPYLPQPEILANKRGKPRDWKPEMVEKLKEYKKTIVTGRNGRFGEFSNPSHKQKKESKNDAK